MYALLLVVIYLMFISLGLPDSLLGAGWPTMHVAFDVPSSYAGYVSMTISFMPFYLLIFAILNIGMLERTYVVLKKKPAKVKRKGQL